MSYDLAVWEGEHPSGNEAAAKFYAERIVPQIEEYDLCNPVPPTPRIRAYVEALLTRRRGSQPSRALRVCHLLNASAGSGGPWIWPGSGPGAACQPGPTVPGAPMQVTARAFSSSRRSSALSVAGRRRWLGAALSWQARWSRSRRRAAFWPASSPAWPGRGFWLRARAVMALAASRSSEAMHRRSLGGSDSGGPRVSGQTWREAAGSRCRKPGKAMEWM